MGDLFCRRGVIFLTGLVAAVLAWSSLAQAQGEPPARVGRLAFVNGPVSFHDQQQSGWTPAVVNSPLTSGDALWTEPNARSEISLAGTRVRMEGATQLDMLAIDDSQTRLQLDQGRIDVKSLAMDTNQPYQILTPRGTVALLQQGDYYVEAGSTEDPTRLGVRAGAAQIQALNGQVLTVRPGEVGEVLGDASSPQLRTINTAPPAPPAYWAGRDRQVTYDQPPQYLSAGITGYENLNAYGSWINDGSYGEVWAPRAVPAGWAPYRTGRWIYQQPWGWTWVDDQPWGFAPYHYGRWANIGGRWVWVPPQRDVQPVYAPALVAFVGGIELAATLANRSVAPVGWFPLGPREVYVPSYTTNQDYYLRLNRSARVQDEILRERWERAQRREAFEAGQRAALMNQRFATVVPTSAFVGSQPVMRSALQVAPNQIAAAPVAPVAAPPAPTVSIANAAAQPARTLAPSATAPGAAGPAAPNNIAVARTAVADMPTLAKPATIQAQAAPGPKIAATQSTAPTADQSKPALPALAPRQGVAPPALKGAITSVPSQPAKPGEVAPTVAPQQQAKPAEPTRQQAAPAPAAPAPQQARPAEAPKPQAAPAPAPAAPAPHVAPPAAAPAPQQARPVEPPRPQPQAVPPPQAHPAPPPQQQGQAAPPPPAAPQPQHAAPPPQAHPAPQQTQAPQPQPPHPAPQQAQTPAPQQQPHPTPQPQPQQQQQQQQQQQPQPKKPDEKK